eukprot:TRINITY_DN13089_c0_g1_i2.p1 TRINITY_DN13089_c0_g1~~TRINITY_DN13089_c0_g1_i2.p1  ORF type:complete len:122 (+),score=3.61 TRINITY_DN13089_c0_g1_i2:41-406(+)
MGNYAFFLRWPQQDLGYAHDSSLLLQTKTQSRNRIIVITAILAWSGILLGGISFILYLILAGENGERLSGASRWLTAVWAFMTLKWAGGTAYQITLYQRQQALVDVQHERSFSAISDRGEP